MDWGWYTFWQANSGGVYIGPAHAVAVRAPTYRLANAFALAAGVDPDAPHCGCCGPHWRLFAGEPARREAVEFPPGTPVVRLDTERILRYLDEDL